MGTLTTTPTKKTRVPRTMDKKQSCIELCLTDMPRLIGITNCKRLVDQHPKGFGSSQDIRAMRKRRRRRRSVGRGR